MKFYIHCDHKSMNHFFVTNFYRVLLRFEFHVPHQILYTTLATDKRLPLKLLSYLLPKLGNQPTKNGHVSRK